MKHMSYQALARKWRPHNFKEMVGQEHVLQAMANAFDQNRIHHAYLFSGTRGVGKTTIARIIAKCLNCLQGVSSQPCESCKVCQEVDQGRHIDLIEVDAASKTKVEDTRNLLENVQYAPIQGRYKIYLIDEVHMLSGHSFNALLKTLEEPPQHVKFLLATTEPQRLPITVLSRCLQFNLKNLNREQISSQLTYILEQEHISYDALALDTLATAANGSMRDALSLLDQAIAFGGGSHITEANTRTMLGNVEKHHIEELLTAIVNTDALNLFNIITTLAELGADFATLLEDLLSLLHQLAIAQSLNTPFHETDKRLPALVKQLGKEEIQLYYQIALIGRRDLPLAPTAQSGFEMIMLRMLAFQQRTAPIGKELSSLQHDIKPSITARPQTLPTPSFEDPLPTNLSHSLAAIEPVTVIPDPILKPIENPQSTDSDHDWFNLVTKLNLSGMTLALARNCTLSKMQDSTIELLLDAKQKPLHTKLQEKLLLEALNQHLGKSFNLNIQLSNTAVMTPAKLEQQLQVQQQQQAMQLIEKDDNVQKLIKTFNATIQTESVVLIANPPAAKEE
ncbi:hypothetical protein BH10PSE19_BH10PSE19_19160 [soil metagenome]